MIPGLSGWAVASEEECPQAALATIEFPLISITIQICEVPQRLGTAMIAPMWARLSCGIVPLGIRPAA